MSNSYRAWDLLVKSLIIGETDVGKTSLLQRYCQTCGCKDSPTIGKSHD